MKRFSLTLAFTVIAIDADEAMEAIGQDAAGTVGFEWVNHTEHEHDPHACAANPFCDHSVQGSALLSICPDCGDLTGDHGCDTCIQIARTR